MEPAPFPGNRGVDNPATARSRAFKLIKERSFSKRKVTLASGKESNFYFDLKPTMFNPEGSLLLAELILQKLDGLNIDFVGGLAMGAVPLIGPINMLSFQKGKPLPGFFVRKEVKDHGTKRIIEGAESLKGMKVVILDDVTTSGGSAMIAVNAAKDAGAKVVLVLSVVDREEGATKFFADKGIPFAALFTASAFTAD
jgi:orotate phosphoribosyltransferase